MAKGEGRILSENPNGVGRFMAYRAATQQIGDRHAGERNVAIGAGLIVISAVWLGVVGALAGTVNQIVLMLVAIALFQAAIGLVLARYKNTLLAVGWLVLSLAAALTLPGGWLGLIGAIFTLRGTLQLDALKHAARSAG